MRRDDLPSFPQKKEWKGGLALAQSVVGGRESPAGKQRRRTQASQVSIMPGLEEKMQLAGNLQAGGPVPASQLSAAANGG